MRRLSADGSAEVEKRPAASDGMSTGTAIGLGIGLAMIIGIFFGLGFWYYCDKRGRRRASERVGISPDEYLGGEASVQAKVAASANARSDTISAGASSSSLATSPRDAAGAVPQFHSVPTARGGRPAE